VFKNDKAIARELMYEYVVVNVDIGRFNKNLELAEKYRADLKSGVPYLTLLDAKGNVVVNQETGALESKEPGKSEHDTKAVLEFLKKHRAEPVAAGNALDHALSLARAENKRVFLHFGAPWCGWCHKLEAWMARPEVAALLAKDYVDLKIDTDRMTGGDDFLKKFNPKAGTPEGGGIPWIAILNADGVGGRRQQRAQGQYGLSRRGRGDRALRDDAEQVVKEPVDRGAEDPDRVSEGPEVARISTRRSPPAPRVHPPEAFFSDSRAVAGVCWRA
jgi:thiol-disulfide isomerase/thioredoxin